MRQPQHYEPTVPTPVHDELDQFVRDNAPSHIQQAWEIQKRYFADVERTLVAIISKEGQQ